MALTVMMLSMSAGALLAQPRLTPAGARRTDDAIARDLRTLRDVRQQVDALPAATPATSRYQRSKAQHWMTFVESEYADNERGPVVDDALARVVMLLTAVGTSTVSPDDESPLPGTTPVRPDLHAHLAAHRARAMSCEPEMLGEFTVKLLSAAHAPGAVGRMNAAAAIRRAEALDAALHATPCGSTMVATAPTAVPPVAALPEPEGPPASATDAERTVTIPGVVHFAFARTTLSAATRALLDQVARNLRDLTAVRIEITGHADRHGAAAVNQRLALRRARRVQRYLAAAGVPSARISVRSRGEAVPIDRRRTAAADARNRRAEIRVLTSDGAIIRLDTGTSDVQPRRRR